MLASQDYPAHSRMITRYVPIRTLRSLEGYNGNQLSLDAWHQNTGHHASLGHIRSGKALGNPGNSARGYRGCAPWHYHTSVTRR